jgi:hypothetical protein
MIGFLRGFIPGGPLLLAGAAIAGLVAGVWLGVKVSDVQTWQARLALAETMQDIAEQSAAEERTARIEAERRSAAASRIAAASAEEAKNLTVEVRRLREVHRDVTTIFREEPRDPACDCSLSDATRRRLLDIPIRQPAPRPGAQPAAPAERGEPPVPGPGRRP